MLDGVNKLRDSCSNKGVSSEKEPLNITQVTYDACHASQDTIKETNKMYLEKMVPTIHGVITFSIVALSNFLFGYNIGVMNAPASVVFQGHTVSEWSLAVSIFCVGGPFGAISASYFADTRGRKYALFLGIYLFIVGGILQACAPSMLVFTLGRLVTGVASGISCVLVPIYLDELTPQKFRGFVGSISQLVMVIGILASFIIAFPFATVGSWRILFSITPLIATVQSLSKQYVQESPRWLLSNDANSKEAMEIIKKLKGFQNDDEAFVTVNSILVTVCSKKKCTPGEMSVLEELLRDKQVRNLVISSLVLHMANQFSGINAIFYYSTTLFEGVISNPLIGTAVVGAFQVVSYSFASSIMNSCGRRTLILWSSGGTFISSIAIILSLHEYFHKSMTLVFVSVFVFFFSIGLGPIPFLIISEMFDAKYVTTIMSICTQFNWICNFIVGMIFPYFVEYLGPFSFGPFSFCIMGTFIFVFKWFPETHGMTPDEVKLRSLGGKVTVDVSSDVECDQIFIRISEEYEELKALIVI